jgi:hypothetical protein
LCKYSVSKCFKQFQNAAQANQQQPLNNNNNNNNASISNAVNNLAQNTAHLLSQANSIGLGSIGTSLPNSASGVAVPSASSNSSSSANASSALTQTSSISSLNNLLLVQQLLNSSLPQLQSAANASPMSLANANANDSLHSNGQNLQNLATLLQLAQKPSNLLNMPARTG